jgi:hypothetical protein
VVANKAAFTNNPSGTRPSRIRLRGEQSQSEEEHREQSGVGKKAVATNNAEAGNKTAVANKTMIMNKAAWKKAAVNKANRNKGGANKAAANKAS